MHGLFLCQYPTGLSELQKGIPEYHTISLTLVDINVDKKTHNYSRGLFITPYHSTLIGLILLGIAPRESNKQISQYYF